MRSTTVIMFVVAVQAVNSNIRFTARITGSSIEPKTRHYVGLPPIMTGGIDHRSAMPIASILVIEEETDGVFLVRFTGEGKEVGDTWHRSIKEAMEQASFEFHEMVSEWKPVPLQIEDVVSFVREHEFANRKASGPTD